MIEQRHLEHFRKSVGDVNVKTDRNDLQTYGKDWTRGYTADPSCVVLPKNTEEVSAVLRYCHEQGLAVVPSGGRTGLAAAAYAQNQEVVVALDRMNKIIRVDDVGLAVEVEAGVTTQAVQDCAREHGLYFALNLASKGSCQIGGNIATNAGGTKLIRYGGMREQVLGIEVVLANGEIIDMNTNLRKNNTGYDLKQLFIGSEGTLGIVTRATLKLIPPPKDFQLVCMASSSFAKIPQVLRECHLLGIQPTAFEFFSALGLDLVLKFHKNLRAPFAEGHPYYLLIEQESLGDNSDLFERLCERCLELDLVSDAVLSSNSEQFHGLWGLRENISESISQYGHVRKNDISLPIESLDSFVRDIDEIVAKVPEEIQLVLFGHIGDGNLHINYIAPKTLAIDRFKNIAEETEKKIFAQLPKYKGSVSAEHGIGLVKKEDLKLSRSPVEIDLMRQIKLLVDPKGIMNPGKIFDP
jgi:FAD/FMN-containing dehydrogenase